MIYTIKQHHDRNFSVLTEDGGRGDVHDNGEALILTLYQNRYPSNNDDGKQYFIEFTYDTPRDTMVTESLNWLAPNIKQFTYVR
jgi:hypothetical protein